MEGAGRIKQLQNAISVISIPRADAHQEGTFCHWALKINVFVL